MGGLERGSGDFVRPPITALGFVQSSRLLADHAEIVQGVREIRMLPAELGFLQENRLPKELSGGVEIAVSGRPFGGVEVMAPALR